MEAWIEFGRGPLFRLSFVLMILGLLRIFLSAFIAGMKRSIEPAEVPELSSLKPVFANQMGIMAIPFWKRPVEVLVELIFHVAVIIVPLFVAAHVIQWHKGVGFAWFQLPQTLADNVTLLVIFLAPLLAGLRLWRHAEFGRAQAFLRPMFVVIPFITGYICVNGSVSPTAYYSSMFLHVWTGNLLMLAVGFSGLADLVIAPITEASGRAGIRFGRFVDPIWKAAIGGGDES